MIKIEFQFPKQQFFGCAYFKLKLKNCIFTKHSKLLLFTTRFIIKLKSESFFNNKWNDGHQRHKNKIVRLNENL